MLDFLNEVLLIEDLEPDAYQMGISGTTGAKMKAPDGGNAGIKGDFNALHPRYPKGHPQGGKFMPKGSKDQIQAIAKNTGQSVEKVAAAVGGKVPANKGKLSKFSGSAGAVGKAQKVLKNKESTPEQRAKAKASIQKAAMKMRGEAPAIAEKPKRGKISNKEIMTQNAGTSAPTPSGSMTQGVSKKANRSGNADVSIPPFANDAKFYTDLGKKKAPKSLREKRSDRKEKLIKKAISNPKATKLVANVNRSAISRGKYGTTAPNSKAIAKSIARNAKKKAKR